MIFGSDLFFAEALETRLHVDRAGEMSVPAQAGRVTRQAPLDMLEIGTLPDGRIGDQSL